MSDLISRSKLLKEIETWGGCVEALHEYIEKMPTAYDINEVVKELKQAGSYKAIEIVKHGGVSDDVYDWHCDEYGRWHTQCNILGDNSPLEYTYCPYCGKKIKVVE